MSQRVRIPLFGTTNRGSSIHPDTGISGLPGHADYNDAQALWNMMPLPDLTGQTEGILVPFPGLSSRAVIKSSGDKNARGLCVYADPTNDYDERLACIINNNFYYATNSSGSSWAAPSTVNSAIDTGYGDQIMLNYQSGATSQVVWSKHRSGSSGAGYYDPSTDTQDVAATIGSSLANGSPLTLSTINRQLLGNDGQSWVTSAPGSLQLDSTNRLAEAEAFPDRLLRIISLHPYTYMMGTRSIEIYQNTGSGKPPFSRLPNGVLRYGLYNASMATVYDDQIYFVDDKRRPAVMSQGQVRLLGTPFINRLFTNVTATDGKILAFDVRGARVVLFVLVTQSSASSVTDPRVLAYYPDFNIWARIGDPTQSNLLGTAVNIWHYSYHAAIGPSNYFLHKDNGTLYAMSEAALQYDGTNFLTTERATQPVNSGLLGAEPDRWVYMSRLVLYTSVGSGSITSSSGVSMQYSDDSGETWSTAKTASLGAAGDYGQEVYWTSLGRFKNRIFRFRHTPDSSNTPFVPFYRLYADIAIAGSS